MVKLEDNPNLHEFNIINSISMKPCDVVELQKDRKEDPSFSIEHLNIGRGFMKSPQHISVVVWRIVENELLTINNPGIFYNAETYLIRFTLKCVEKNELRDSTIFFFWKGSRAATSFSPLPPNFDNEFSIVHRITQWSEPAIYFQIFENPIVVFDGKYSEFNPNKNHLFFVRGELKEELHLFELPFYKKHLRSRGIFIIVDSQQNKILVWKGLAVSKDLEKTFKEVDLVETLKIYENSWKNYESIEIKEYEEDAIFKGDNSTYWHCQYICNFSPRLFFLNSITGEFVATEVEYPLRSKNHISAFPFLQSHLLMTDIQPGLFLLDNHHEIWLISSGIKPSEELNALAMETANNFVKEKERQLNNTVLLKFVTLGAEPIEFVNIFPYWK